MDQRTQTKVCGYKNMDLVEAIGRLYADPLGFVHFIFPWGEGELKGEEGPDKWQVEVLEKIGERVKPHPHPHPPLEGEGRKREDALPGSERDAPGEIFNQAIQIAVSSGHGVGKSALCAWIILWFLSTRPHPQAVVTANTKTQLTTKTWRELAKWHRLAINHDWFEWTATKFILKAHPETWFASAIPWSENRPEAFAGTHEKYVLMIFDEASAIPDIIWETAEGAMTTAGAMWLAFGNPTRNKGRFKECWGKFRHRWFKKQVDSRTAKKADKGKIDAWITDYGEDSDFVRIRVKGEFPRTGSTQFISEELVNAAVARAPALMGYSHAPIVIGVDVARFGDDQSVILVRQGQYIHRIRKFREKNTMQLAGYVIEEINRFKADATFVDGVGVGAGVVDRLRELGFPIIEVNAGSAAKDEKVYANLRVEMWDKMRKWLETGSLPDDLELKGDLTGLEYGFDNKGRFQLETKGDMKGRGLASPDVGDALAHTFAMPVSVDLRSGRAEKAETEFDVFAT